MVKTVLLTILFLLVTYLVTGIIKVLSYYVFLYVAWKHGGQKPIRGTHTTVEIDEEGNEVEGTEEIEEVIYDSPHELLTVDIREYVYEDLTEKMSPTLAHDCLYLMPVRIILLIMQFIIDVLCWPKTHTNFKFNLGKNESVSK